MAIEYRNFTFPSDSWTQINDETADPVVLLGDFQSNSGLSLAICFSATQPSIAEEVYWIYRGYGPFEAPNDVDGMLMWIRGLTAPVTITSRCDVTPAP